MDRDELLEHIRKGEQYLARTDITDKQRQAAEERYCNLVALLSTMPEPKQGVQTHIDNIRRTLDPEGKRRKNGNHSA